MNNIFVICCIFIVVIAFRGPSSVLIDVYVYPRLGSL